LKRIVPLLLILTLAACSDDNIAIEGINVLDIPACDSYPDREFRIEDQSSFDVLFQGLISNGACESFTLPVIDFDESTVLGFLSEANNCENDYMREVNAIPDEDRYEFVVTVRLNETCTEEESVLHWVQLPKIPSDFMVVYKQVNN